jgi:hypothetical protein
MRYRPRSQTTVRGLKEGLSIWRSWSDHVRNKKGKDDKPQGGWSKHDIISRKDQLSVLKESH